MKNLLTLAFIMAFLQACKLEKNQTVASEPDENPQQFLYLGIGIHAPLFEKDIPSFGGDKWASEVTIFVDGKKIQSINNGGMNIAIKEFNSKSVIEFKFDSDEEELVYAMVFYAEKNGNIINKWKEKIDTSVTTHFKFKLLTGESLQ